MWIPKNLSKDEKKLVEKMKEAEGFKPEVVTRKVSSPR